MAIVKLRLRPVITAFSVKYIVEKKGWLFWSTDKSEVGTIECDSFQGSFYLTRRYASIGNARKVVFEHYGDSARFVEYKP